MEEINLIAQEERKFIQLTRLSIKVRNIAILFCLFFILITLVVFTLFFSTNNQYKKNEERISSLKETIRGFDKIESYLTTVSERIKNIENVRKNIKIGQILNDFSSLIVPGYSFNSLEVKESSLKAVGSCDNIQSLSNIYEKYEAMKKSKKFTTVKVDGITRSDNGSYSLNFGLIR